MWRCQPLAHAAAPALIRPRRPNNVTERVAHLPAGARGLVCPTPGACTCDYEKLSRDYLKQSLAWATRTRARPRHHTHATRPAAPTTWSARTRPQPRCASIDRAGRAGDATRACRELRAWPCRWVQGGLALVQGMGSAGAAGYAGRPVRSRVVGAGPAGRRARLRNLRSPGSRRTVRQPLAASGFGSLAGGSPQCFRVRCTRFFAGGSLKRDLAVPAGHAAQREFLLPPDISGPGAPASFAKRPDRPRRCPTGPSLREATCDRRPRAAWCPPGPTPPHS
jgi:hypothetical protein